MQATPAAQFQKNKWPNQKMAKELNRYFSREGRTDGLQTQEKMLSITYYQRNANQNHIKVPSQAGKNDCYQKVYKQ